MSTLARLLGWRKRRRRPEAVVDRAYAGWSKAGGGFSAPGPVPAGESGDPLISVVIPVHRTDPAMLAAAIASVTAQDFGFWELVVAEDGPGSPELRRVLESASVDARVHVVRLAESRGIAAATNAALAEARGAFVAFMDHDDLLEPDALGWFARVIAAHPDADLLFSDEDQIVHGAFRAPYFKPGWNPDLMLAQNAVGHLAVYRRSLVEAVGGLREGLDGSQDHDLSLRASVVARQIRHVPRVLYHWRQDAGSFSARDVQRCRDAAVAAVGAHVGSAGNAFSDPDLPQWVRVAFTVPEPAPLVSMIVDGVPPADAEYPHVEHVADAAAARGTVLVFLASGLTPRETGWLRALVAQALRAEIGCAGGRLDGPEGSVVHAGFTLDATGIAHSLQPGSDANDPGYRGQFLLPRSTAAVSMECLAVRAAVFEQLGGWRAQAGAWRDVDLCLRAAAIGLRTVWTPQARLAYRRRPRPRHDPHGGTFMRATWARELASDPYANPNLTVERGQLRLRSHQGATP